MPAPFATLIASLQSRGFTVTTDEISESFGNWLIELESNQRAVRLVRDRGIWSAELRLAGDWLGVDLVRASLDGADDDRVWSLEDTARHLVDLVDRLSPDPREEALLRERAREIGLQWTRRMFGDAAIGYVDREPYEFFEARGFDLRFRERDGIVHADLVKRSRLPGVRKSVIEKYGIGRDEASAATRAMRRWQSEQAD